jgi:hypothetical protein
MQQFQEFQGNPDMGFTSDGRMQIKLNGKVAATLAVGEAPGAIAEDPVNKRVAYVTMLSDEKSGELVYYANLPGGKKFKLAGVLLAKILVNNSSGKFLFEGADASMKKVYFTEAGAPIGTYGSEAEAFDLNGNSVIIMERLPSGNGSKVFRDGKELYTIPASGSGSAVLFNSDASKYCEINYNGIKLSDGKLIERAFLPMVEKSNTAGNLYYLQINPAKEVIQTSMAW